MGVIEYTFDHPETPALVEAFYALAERECFELDHNNSNWVTNTTRETYALTDAMDVLVNLQPPVSDWSFLEEASIPAQRAALARVDRITDKKAAAQLVQALIAAAKPETAADIAGAARIIGSTSDDPNDILLSQWWSLHPPSRKPAFLAALTGIELGESVYSPRFAEIIKDATTAEGPLRDAAFRLLIAQLRLRRDNVEIGAWTGATSAPTSRPSMAPGPIPLIIARSANDPITRGVIAAAREAHPAVRAPKHSRRSSNPATPNKPPSASWSPRAMTKPAKPS
jgi:hypothetical protein